uniref:Transcriptional regulator n=1 Tax=Panagrellus redivivus TaxID=6233 RepID=A0A7E4ZR31_PANRE
MTSDIKQLQKEILSRSNSTDWVDAKREWHLNYIYYCDNYGDNQCLCLHPIMESCVLRNSENGKEAVVGNVCVKKFMDLDEPDKIFQAFHRVTKDNNLPLNEAAIVYARKQDWINDWERGFYLDTWRKRKMTDKQVAKRLEINNLVIRKIRSARRPTNL